METSAEAVFIAIAVRIQSQTQSRLAHATRARMVITLIVKSLDIRIGLSSYRMDQVYGYVEFSQQSDLNVVSSIRGTITLLTVYTSIKLVMN